MPCPKPIVSEHPISKSETAPRFAVLSHAELSGKARPTDQPGPVLHNGRDTQPVWRMDALAGMGPDWRLPTGSARLVPQRSGGRSGLTGAGDPQAAARLFHGTTANVAVMRLRAKKPPTVSEACPARPGAEPLHRRGSHAFRQRFFSSNCRCFEIPHRPMPTPYSLNNFNFFLFQHSKSGGFARHIGTSGFRARRRGKERLSRVMNCGLNAANF